MTTPRLIDLKPDHLVQVQEVLQMYLHDKFPEVRVWVFGSRANGRSHSRSDIDLAIELENGGCLSDEVLDALKRAFDASDLPQRVDVVDIARLKDDAFKRNLLRDRLPLPLGA